MNRKHHRFARFDVSVRVLSWSEAVSSGARSSDDHMPYLCYNVSLRVGVTTEIYRVGSCGPTNYLSTYPNLRTVLLGGGASAAGEQGNPKTAANGVGNGSVLSKIILLVRKFPPIRKHTAPSEVGVSPGTRS